MLDAERTRLATRRSTLHAELAAQPSHASVRAATTALDRAEQLVATGADEHSRIGREVSALVALVRARGDNVRRRAGELALPGIAEDLRAYGAALDVFAAVAAAWLDARAAAGSLAERAALRDGTAQRSSDQAVAARDTAAELAASAEVLAARLAAVEASVGVEFQELDAQLRAITDQLGAVDEVRTALRDRELDLVGKIGGLREQRDADAAATDRAVADRDLAAHRIRRLATGTLGSDAQLDLEPGDGVRAALVMARLLAERVSDAFEERHLRAAQGRLDEAVHEVRERLAGRADLEIEPGDDAVLLTATVDGRRLGAAALNRLLTDEQAAAAAALSSEEHDLFDRTLTGDTRRHVAERIRTADELVRGMNRRLGRVRTASKVRVQLNWQVDPDLPPGTRQARDLLLRDPATLTADERDALHRFFRERITEARDTGGSASWEAQLTRVFDYAAWHRFLVTVDLGDGTGQHQRLGDEDGPRGPSAPVTMPPSLPSTSVWNRPSLGAAGPRRRGRAGGRCRRRDRGCTPQGTAAPGRSSTYSPVICGTSHDRGWPVPNAAGIERADHWREVYMRRGDTQVSWFSADPACSLELIDAAGVDPALPAVDVGAGAARLVDALLGRGFIDVTALDVSDDGLAHTRARLGPDAHRVRCVVADVLDWVPDHVFGLWHDRAVFHFLTDPADRQRYRDLLADALSPGALVVIGTFAADGPESCSGLPTARYTPAGLAAELGDGLQVVAQRREEHRTPWGVVQPFTWLALRR